MLKAVGGDARSLQLKSYFSSHLNLNTDNLTPPMNLPTIYIKPGCPWCDEVVDYLARKGIETRIVIVSGNPEAMREMVALSGQSKAPTMDWHGEVLADFGVDELVPFLKKRGL